MPKVPSINPYVTNDNELQLLFKIYLSECQYTKRLSLHTIKGYQEVFNTFQKIVPEIRNAQDLNPNVLSEFFHRLGTRKRKVGKLSKIGIKPSTTSTYFNKLMAFFRWLESKEYIPSDSISKKIVRPPAPVYGDIKALSDIEVAKIISSITLNELDNTFIYKRDLAMTSTFLYSGIRKGELLALRVSDLDFDRSTIFISHVTSKSKVDRHIPMHPTLRIHLRAYLYQRKEETSTCEYLFISSQNNTPLTEHGLKHWVKKYKKLSGVNFHVHRFRHTFACSLARTGVDITSIMKLLGHTSLRMTERYLRSIQSEDARGFIEKMSF